MYELKSAEQAHQETVRYLSGVLELGEAILTGKADDNGSKRENGCGGRRDVDKGVCRAEVTTSERAQHYEREDDGDT